MRSHMYDRVLAMLTIGYPSAGKEELVCKYTDTPYPYPVKHLNSTSKLIIYYYEINL